jgi:SAM-dependent methyltransferase
MNATVVNVEQARAWDGDEGDDWADEWERYDAATITHHKHLFEVLDFAVADRVLDIGCGTGLSTRDAARRASEGRAHGLDLSARMLDRARELSAIEGVQNVSFEQGDAQAHGFEPASYDIAIGKFVAMFFSDPTAAFANIGSSLRPGGRLALMSWSGPENNEWLTAALAALAAGRDLSGPPVGKPGPFGLADPDLVRSWLTDAGFTDIDCHPHHAPFRFGDDGDDGYRFFQRGGVFRGFTQGLDDEQLAQVHHDLRATMHAHDTGDGVYFESAVWVVTASRR